MPGTGEWLEVRATATGVLDGLGHDVPGAEPSHEGVLSLVVRTDEGERLRRLPTLFLGPSPLFADRDVNEVVARAAETIGFLQRAYSELIFLATAVDIGGARGLYARDYNARSAYRRRLERLGADFASAPFVRLTPDAGFEVEGAEPFTPEFVISEGIDEPEAGVHAVSPGLLVSQVSMLRLGSMSAGDLRSLVRALGQAEGLGSSQPADLYAHLAG